MASRYEIYWSTVATVQPTRSLTRQLTMIIFLRCLHACTANMLTGWLPWSFLDIVAAIRLRHASDQRANHTTKPHMEMSPICCILIHPLTYSTRGVLLHVTAMKKTKTKYAMPTLHIYWHRDSCNSSAIIPPVISLGRMKRSRRSHADVHMMRTNDVMLRASPNLRRCEQRA